MMERMTFVAGAFAVVWLAGAASAQETVVACPSQEGLQQYVESNGATVPQDCRQITVQEAGGGMCSFEIGGGGEDNGLMAALAGAAVPTQWWARCGSLEEAAE